MEEVLFRLQRQESRSLTWLLTSLDTAQISCLPTSTASQSGLQIRKRVGCEIFEPLEIRSTAQGLMKSYDSQKTKFQNGQNKTRAAFCAQTDDGISLQPGIINENLPNYNYKTHHGVDALPRTFSLLGLQISFNEGLFFTR